MTACFCDGGSLLSRSEALIIAVTNGSKTSTNSFNRYVGIGSSAQDFVGNIMINCQTSASVHDINPFSDVEAWSVSGTVGASPGQGRVEPPEV